jgi:hypothetical protein
VEPVAAPATAAATGDGLMDLLASPLPHAGLPIRVQAVPFRGDQKKTVVQLVVEISGRTMALAQRGGRLEERIDLALLTIDDRARASNGRSTRMDLRLTPEEADRVKSTGVRWLSRLDLPPGHHQVRVAARAQGSGATGLTSIDVDVPGFDTTRPAMSGVTLTSLPSVLMITRGDGWLSEALATPPSAMRSFVAGDRLTAAVEVYLPAAQPGPAKLAAWVERPDGSQNPLGTKMLKEATAARSAEAAAFAIDTASIPPGRYVLRIVLDAAGREPVERRVPFDVVAPRP